LDAIVDYILFLNFLQVLKESNSYRGREIHLLGNVLWKDLTETLDKDFVNNFILINPNQNLVSPLQTLKLGWYLFKNNYTEVLNPTYSRTLIADGLTGLACSAKTTGYLSDTENIRPKYKKTSDKFYQHKFILPQNIYFEFDKDLYFFETLLKQKIKLQKPHIDTQISEKDIVVIFPGAGSNKRSWEIEKFSELITLLIAQSNHTIYIAGGPSELALASYLIKNQTVNRVINKVNQTSLSQLTELVASAKLVISNETSAIHIASACNTKSICILGGGHFQRFTPYPENIPGGPDCVYKIIPCYNCNWQCIFKTTETEPYPCIAQISVADVWDKVKQVIQN
jgi:ADP-heptose:LPS heptosyltransferase